MISSLQGILKVKNPTLLILEVNKVGYEINIPLSTYDRLARVGEEVTLFTHLYLKEDLLTLYGFYTEEERTIFRHLISISGIGPRLALNILSHLKIPLFKKALAEQDVSILSHIPGIGKKTAARIILELKEKLARPEIEVKPERKLDQDLISNAVKALISLGYNKTIAYQRVIKVSKALTAPFSLEDLVKNALRS